MKNHSTLSSRWRAATDRWLEPSGSDAIITASLILLLTGVSAIVVYRTGGIKYVYSHAMYLPIVLGAIFHRTKGGIATAVLAGLLLGPWMPLDTASGEMQAARNWLFRLAAFAVIGTTAGVAVQTLRNRLDHERWLGTHDAATRLGNMAFLAQVGEAHLAKHPGDSLDCIIIEASNMSTIVGTLGMEWADRIIRQLADRIAAESGTLICVGRYQTNKLALLGTLPDNTTLEDEVLDFMHQGHTTCADGDLTVFVELRSGAARVTGEGADSILVALRQADGALEHARLKGRTAAVYNPTEDQSNREAVARLGQLRRALKEGELRLYFHPKVCTRTRQTRALEALLRWEHPTEGLIPPGLFIPQAEATSLINDLTDWVIQEALTWLATWRGQGFDITISANACPRDLKTTDFCQKLEDALKSHDTAPSTFELEITESAIMHEPDQILGQLKRIRGLQVTLSIDDFGTGYSSLAYLGLIPAVALKIDQAFVRDLETDAGARSIASAATQLAHDFGMRAIAEGVETAALLDAVTALGVDEAQGYYFTKPIPADAVADWLTNSDWPAARIPQA